MKHTNYLIFFAIVLSTLGGLTGCKKTTGGGSVEGNFNNGGKISLGFQMRCENVGGFGYITGQFQYKDHPAGVAFHGAIDKSVQALIGEQLSCEDLGLQIADSGFSGSFGWLQEFFGTSLGTYTPQPKNFGLGGELSVIVNDESSSFPISCDPGFDQIIVQLVGGVYDGYVEGGCLSHGNFTVFEHG